MKKIILILILVIGISGIGRAEWWSIVHLKWDAVNVVGPYVLDVRQIRQDGTVIEYQIDAGDRKYQDIDVEPGNLLEVEIYAHGKLISEITFRGYSIDTPGEIIKF